MQKSKERRSRGEEESPRKTRKKKTIQRWFYRPKEIS